MLSFSVNERILLLLHIVYTPFGDTVSAPTDSPIWGSQDSPYRFW